MASEQARNEQEIAVELFKQRLKILFDFFGDVANIIVVYEGAYPCVYCAYCGSVDLKKGSSFWISCINCHEMMYCCVPHKKDHWKTHQPYCFKIENIDIKKKK